MILKMEGYYSDKELKSEAYCGVYGVLLDICIISGLTSSRYFVTQLSYFCCTVKVMNNMWFMNTDWEFKERGCCIIGKCKRHMCRSCNACFDRLASPNTHKTSCLLEEEVSNHTLFLRCIANIEQHGC